MLVTIDHVGIVINDIEQAIRLFRDGFALKLVSTKTYHKQGMKVAILEAENISIELIQPIGPGPYWNPAGISNHINHLAFKQENAISNAIIRSADIQMSKKRRKLHDGYLYSIEPTTSLGLNIQLVRRR